MENFNALVFCNAGGNKAECETLKELLQEHTNRDLITSWVGNTFLACISWPNLFYVIQVSDVKAVYKALFKIFHGRIFKYM